MASREQLREQHELTQEIGNAITSMPITEPIDEDELEADLAALEQENLDEKMLKTGTMPVADSLNRLPKAANGEREFFHPPPSLTNNRGWKERKKLDRLTNVQSKANRKRRSKKKTRRRSCGSCRRRWRCESTLPYLIGELGSINWINVLSFFLKESNCCCCCYLHSPLQYLF